SCCSECPSDKMREGDSLDLEDPPEQVSLTVNSPTVSGHLTPMRTNTMKECEQLIEELRKENFSLKLRIYFLEDRCRQKFGSDDTFKMNIELNVQVESLKNEVVEKQELLKKAYHALESLSNSHQQELKKAIESKEKEWTKDKENLLIQLSDTEKELAVAKLKLEDTDVNVARLQADFHNQAEKLKLTVVDHQKQMNEGLTKDADLQDLQKMVDQLGSELESKHRLEDNYLEKIKALEKTLGRKERDFEDMIDDKQENIKKMESEIQLLNTSVNEKGDSVALLEERLRKVESELESEKTNGLKKNKLIKGLTQNLQEKRNEIQELQKHILKDKEDLNKTRQELYEVSLQKHKNLIDSIEKKEQELNSFRDMLTKTRDALKQSEDAVQQLQDQLLREKREAKEKLDQQMDQYQLVIEDLEHQSHSKDLLVQQLSDNLKEKDKQLHQYLQLLRNSNDEVKSGVIENLEERLKEKEESLQKTMANQIHIEEEFNMEIQQLRLALRERNSNMEKANQMLLSAQETIDMIGKQSKMKDLNINKLSSALKAAQNVHKEQTESHSRIMEEKDDLLQHLQNAIKAKNNALEESLHFHVSDSENKVVELEKRMLAKDQLLQELMEEKKKSALGNEKLSYDLLDKLKMKDSDMKNLIDKQNLEMADKIRELQKLRLEISRKDYEIQTLEANSALIEKMQDTEMKKLRSSLEDRDKTIKTLVDSCQQKESLIRQLQESNSHEAAKQQTMSIEFQYIQDELRKYQDSDSPPEVIEKSQKFDDELKKAKEELFTAWNFEYKARMDAEKMRGRMIELERENQALQELRKEYVHNRDRASEASSPCRSSVKESDQKMWELMQQQLEEMKALRDSLLSEQNIWVSLRKSAFEEPSRVERELLALQNLRQQLEQGIDENNKLRSNMFRQLKADLDSHHRSSQSLDHSSNGMPVLPLSVHQDISPTETYGSGSEEIANLQSQSNKTLLKPGSSLPKPIVSKPHFKKSGSHTTCSTPATSHSLNQFTLDEQSCSGNPFISLSYPQQKALSQKNASLAKSPPEHEHFQLQLEVLQALLDKKNNENVLLRGKLGLVDHVGEIDPKHVPDVNQLKKEVGDLKTELNKASNTISILKQQISINSQDEAPFKPELIIHMAKEIRKLREDRKSCRCTKGVTGGSLSSFDKENSVHHRRSRSKKDRNSSILKTQSFQEFDDTLDSDSQVMILRDRIKEMDAVINQQNIEVEWYKKTFGKTGKSPWNTSDKSTYPKSPFSKDSPPCKITGGGSSSGQFKTVNDTLINFHCKQPACIDNVHRLKNQVAELNDQIQRDLEIINSLQSDLAIQKNEQQRLSGAGKECLSGYLTDLSATQPPPISSPRKSKTLQLPFNDSGISNKLLKSAHNSTMPTANCTISEVMILLKHLSESYNVSKQLTLYLSDTEKLIEKCVQDISLQLQLKKKLNKLFAVSQRLQSLLQGPYGENKNSNNNALTADALFPEGHKFDKIGLDDDDVEKQKPNAFDMDQNTLDTLSENALKSMRRLTEAATMATDGPLLCHDSPDSDKTGSKSLSMNTGDNVKRLLPEQYCVDSKSPVDVYGDGLDQYLNDHSTVDACIPNKHSLSKIEADFPCSGSFNEFYRNSGQLKWPQDKSDSPLSPHSNAKSSAESGQIESNLDNQFFPKQTNNSQIRANPLEGNPSPNGSLPKYPQSRLSVSNESPYNSKSLPSSPSNVISSKDVIRSHLMVSQDLSNTLQHEISVYNFLESSTANSLNMSSNQSLNGSQLESFYKYLMELRAQRIKLEGTVDRNERLQEKLVTLLNHDRIKGSPTNVAKDIAQLEEQKRQLTYFQDLLGDQQAELDHRHNRIEQLSTDLDDKTKQLNDKDILLQQKDGQIDQLKQQLQEAQSQIQTLELELQDLREQLSENKNLNSTLKLELDMYEQLEVKSKPKGKSKKFDIREFLAELRNLRKSMERCINTNNILRRKLEELLVSNNISCLTTTNTSLNLSLANSSQHESKSNKSNLSTSEPTKTGNLASGVQSQLELARSQPSDDEQQVDSAHGSGDSEFASSLGNNTSELLKQTIDIIDSSSSPPVAQHHSSQSLSRNLFGSQLTSVMNDDVTNSLKPLQMDSCDEAGSSNSSLPNGQSNGSDNLHKEFESCQSSNGSKDIRWTEDVLLGKGGMAGTWPASYSLAKDHITYWSFDPPGSPANSPVRISSDLRSLFAIGKLDDYELLRKENGEMSCVVRKLQAQLHERIKIHKSHMTAENAEYSILRELSLLVNNLNVCLNEESRLIGNFWLSQLPARYKKGQVSKFLQNKKNADLITEINEIHNRYVSSPDKGQLTEENGPTQPVEEGEEDLMQHMKDTEAIFKSNTETRIEQNPA
ncbi:thyroid receptor-interacting protein 11-like isoform X3, partial [Argonauta hians]